MQGSTEVVKNDVSSEAGVVVVPEEQKDDIGTNAPIIDTKSGSRVVQLTMAELGELVDSRVQQESNKIEALEATVRQQQEQMVALTALLKSEKSINVTTVEEGSNEDEQLIKGSGSQDNQEQEEGLKRKSLFKMHTPYGETVYTLIYMSNKGSQSFVYSLFVYALQILTLSLTLVDILHLDSENNPLQIPPMVALTVTWAQGVTIFMALAYQSDLIEAVMKIQNGFYPEVMEQHPGATFGTWLVSCIAQLIAGLLLLSTIFILTMQSDNVLGIMLNFAALHFIAEIDDFGFAIAKLGFITSQLQEEVKAVIDVHVPRRKGHKLYKRALYLFTLSGLFIGYGILKDRQLDGHYLPTHIYVQFGDAYNPKLPYYSGIMTSTVVRSSTHRQYRDRGTEVFLLAYCNTEKAWTFSEHDDPCDYFAKSYETTTYDVTAIPNHHWEVLDVINRLQPFDSFAMAPRDCDPETCQGECGTEGLCHCPHNKFGMDCEFSGVCPELAVDVDTPSFPAVSLAPFEISGVSSHFHLLKNDATQEYVKVYDMPVYYSNDTYPADILFFGGRRWIITSEWDLIDLTQAESNEHNKWYFPEKTVAKLENNFHAHYNANYTPLFISDAVDFETVDFQPTPAGLKWWTIQEGNLTLHQYTPDNHLETELRCITELDYCVGKSEDFCHNGFCNNDTGLCECNPYMDYQGARCNEPIPCFDQFIECGAHGSCDTSSGICRCNLPYFGNLCEESYKCYEEGGTCQNGGVCNMTTGRCDCPLDPAISGLACERRANCNIFGCANGGLCGFNGKCVCRPPFEGSLCDLVDSSKDDLLCTDDDECMDGICNVATGLCECENLNSYGPLCEHRFNCSTISIFDVPTCLNSGICNGTTGVCDCPDPFSGPDCSKIPRCLRDSDCGLWNTCDIESGLCICGQGLAAGRFCEDDFRLCSSNEDCHGGVCHSGKHCECDRGWGGTFCESFVAGMYGPILDTEQFELEDSISRCGFDDPWCCNSSGPYEFLCGV